MTNFYRCDKNRIQKDDWSWPIGSFISSSKPGSVEQKTVESKRVFLLHLFLFKIIEKPFDNSVKHIRQSK